MIPAPLRFGIVGCGAIGAKRLHSLPKGAVVAACDLVYGKAAALAAKAGGDCLATTKLSEVLRLDLDAVIVATLNADLMPIAAECIRSGKHVLIEKPVAVSVAQVSELHALAIQKSVLVRAGYNHRYHRAFRKAREIYDSGALGPLMFIRGRYGHGGRVGYDREWRADPALSGGGELMDQGVHLIDLAGWFMGPWTSIEGRANTYFWDMPVDDNAFLHLRNRSGNAAWLHVSCTEWKNLFSFEVYGRDAKLHVEGLGGSYGVERLHYYRMLPEMGPPETIIYEYPGDDPSWALEMQEFMEDIRLNRQPVPGLIEAKAALEVVESVYSRSGYSGSNMSATT